MVPPGVFSYVHTPEPTPASYGAPVDRGGMHRCGVLPARPADACLGACHRGARNLVAPADGGDDGRLVVN